MRALLILGAACVALSLGWAAVRPAHPACRIEVTTASGDLYIAGAGDTIADAWQGARLPEGYGATIIPACD